MNSITHEELMLREAELVIDPYRDMARAVCNLVLASCPGLRQYPNSDLDLVHVNEEEEAKGKTFEDYEGILIALAGKDKVEKALDEIKSREPS
jgi:hypothetical protein